jgi:peptide deformylase
MVNPNITMMSDSTIATAEGCLSIPGKRRAIQRAESVTVEYLDYELIPRTATFSGLNSIVVQHEIDHLNGLLITDYEGLDLVPS